MTRINLLPDDYRKADRTPPLLFLGVVSAILLVCGSLGAVGYLYFVLLGTASAEFEVATDERNTLRPFADYANNLEREKGEYEKRQRTIVDIGTSRIQWTRKIDQLANIIHNDGDVDRHMIWLDTLQINVQQQRDAGLKLKGNSGGRDLTRLSAFHRDLWSDDVLYEKFASISDPEGTVEVEEELVPQESFQFDFNLKLGDKK